VVVASQSGRGVVALMKLSYGFSIFICTSVLVACSSEVNVELDNTLGAITEGNLRATTSYLADDARNGRRAGSPGHEDAANYVAEQFDDIGLQPGGDGGWFQQVPLVNATIDGRNSGVVLHTGSGDVELAWIKDAVVFPDAVREDGRIQAEVVFVGFGIHAPEFAYSDYDDVDIEGKIVALFGGGPESFPEEELAFYSSARNKAAESARRGAVGTILMWNRQEEEDRDWDKYYDGYPSRPRLSWANGAGEASNYYPELLAAASISAASARKLFEDAPITFESALDAAEESRPLSTALGIEVTLYQETRHERFNSPNVIGILPGSDPELTNKHVVFSAHLDHAGTKDSDEGDVVYNGFFDNAVGVAIMLESARALAKLAVAPRRSIVFIAVTGEEAGLLGSDYFVNNPASPDTSIVANVNVDLPMLIFPMNTITTWGAERTSFEEAAAAEVALEGFEARPYPYPDEEVGEIKRSDQYSFVKKGIPFIWMMEGVGSSDPTVDGLAIINAFYDDHYHQVSDDLSQPIHWDSARRYARASARITRRLAMEDDAPTWNEGDFYGEKFARK
jgi:hypothetical protein